MAYDRFMIAPYNSGLQTDVKQWLITDDAMAELSNAYVYRGRIRKRFGSVYSGYGAPTPQMLSLYSRLRINIGTTNGAGVLAGNVPGTIYKIGQQFSVGNVVFTVTTAGAGIQMNRTDASAEAATYNTGTGAYSITIAAFPATAVYFYPAEPVMGISQYEIGTINNQPTYAFDTQFAYVYAGGSWDRSLTAAVPVFTSSDSQFVWTCNWRGATAADVVLFVTNFKANEMAYYNGTWTQPWTINIVPGGATQVLGAKIIVPFKDRLLLLNTIETGPLSFVNRCRFSHNGSPLAAHAFYIPNSVGATGGGYVDAPTKEAIVSAQFIRDRLIVYFEQSTWEIVYTGNQVLPFVWQRLNTELGSQSTFSSVPFDKAVLTVGKTGIHACNGVNVERVDDKIPQKVFEVRNSNNGSIRIAGIRDYFTEMVYWSMPINSGPSADVYPNTVLVYNYANGSWALNDDCITAFGYFEQQLDRTWANTTTTWQDATFTWASGVVQAQFRQIFAGNQQGFVFIVSPDCARNASVMSITNMTQVGLFPTLTIMNHTLKTLDAIYIENCLGSTTFNGQIFQVEVVDANTIRLLSAPTLVGTYTGGGVVARVSSVNIKTKQFNPYSKDGKNVYISKVDFYVDRTSHGQITVDYSPSSTTASTLAGSVWSGSILGTGILETTPYAALPQETLQDRLWHPLYFNVDGDGIQFSLYFDIDQLCDPTISLSDIQIHAMVLYTMPISRLQ